ncbi:MAG: hypothetical protein K6F35_01560 [Lachnospiraceae bacterium]|nr:hypothetical protein [Lachnospiraceae bacterium]
MITETAKQCRGGANPGISSNHLKARNDSQHVPRGASGGHFFAFPGQKISGSPFSTFLFYNKQSFALSIFLPSFLRLQNTLETAVS